MYVSGLNSKLLKKAEQSLRIRLVPVNDWDFNDVLDPAGEPIYEFANIPDDFYTRLQEGWLSTSVETLTVPMDMIVTNSWIKQHAAVYEAISRAALRSQDEIRQHVSQY